MFVFQMSERFDKYVGHGIDLIYGSRKSPVLSIRGRGRGWFGGKRCGRALILVRLAELTASNILQVTRPLRVERDASAAMP